MKLSWVWCLPLLFATAAQSEVKDRASNGFTIENSAEVPVSAEDAWRGLVEDVGHWWPADHTWFGASENLSIDPAAGGCFCEIAAERRVEHMRVIFSDPGRLLRMSGGLGPMQGLGWNGVLEWRFTPLESGGTRITLWYRVGGYSPDDMSTLADVVDRVMAGQLGALAEHLAPAASSSAE